MACGLVAQLREVQNSARSFVPGSLVALVLCEVRRRQTNVVIGTCASAREQNGLIPSGLMGMGELGASRATPRARYVQPFTECARLNSGVMVSSYVSPAAGCENLAVVLGLGCLG